MKRWMRIALILIAVISFGIAFSYPVIYRQNQKRNTEDLNDLAALRRQLLTQEGASPDETNAEGAASGASSEKNVSGQSGDGEPGKDTATAGQAGKDGTGNDSSAGKEISDGTGNADTGGSGTAGRDGKADAGENTASAGNENTVSGGQGQDAGQGSDAGGSDSGNTEDAVSGQTEPPQTEPPTLEDLLLDYVPGMTWRQVKIPEFEVLDAPVMVSGRTAVKDRAAREKALPYNMKEKIQFDEEKMLPELVPAWKRNKDLIGWLVIEDTVIDYPVVQSNDSEYYLSHDFYGQENVNGQIILDPKCDPYTPSYNLIISGHHMRNGTMFGALQQYASYDYWMTHRNVEFDSLMQRRSYIPFAAFYSADYDEYEEGFRYNRDLVYEIDYDMWIEEIERVKLYDTEIDTRFGDEFITLTTCDRSRRQDGRFVLICRKIREGEEIS